MVFSFERPRARVSDSFYRPECRFIEKSFRKTYREATPLKEVSSSSYERSSRRREVRSQIRSAEKSSAVQRFRSASMPPVAVASHAQTSAAAKTLNLLLKARDIYSDMKYKTDLYFRKLLLASAQAVAEEVNSIPIWKKHPYYLDVEREYVPPAEDSVWPMERPHFHLVSSYDLMCKYLGLESLKSPLPGTGTYLVK